MKSAALPSRRAIAAGLVGCLVLLGAWMTYQLLQAKSELEAARADADELRTALADGRTPEVERLAESLRVHAAAADGSLSGPHWWLAAHLPFVGDDIGAVRTITFGLNTVSTRNLPDLIDLYSEISGDAFRPVDGRIDTAALRSARDRLATSANGIASTSRSVAAIDTSGLIGPLRGPVGEVQRTLSDAAEALRRASVAADVLPDAVEGRHRYLLLFLNPAEIRAGGGMPGSWAELKVDDGRVSLGKQGAAADEVLDSSPSELTADELQFYNDRLGRDLRNVLFTPDFPRSADLARTLMERKRGLQVDGVLAMDAVTLAHLLNATGPVDLLDGTRITAENAVAELLNGVYLRTPDPNKQDAIFAAAVDTLFTRFTDGDLDPTETVRALVRSGEEHRVRAWFADPALQARIADTAVAGELPATEAAPGYGIYFNDATGAKMQYYLDVDARTDVSCGRDDTSVYSTDLTLTSTAPKDAASLPEAVVGPNPPTGPGGMAMQVDILAPAGGSVPVIEQDGDEPTYYSIRVDGRPGARIIVALGPGDTTKLRITSSAAPGVHADTAYEITPTVRSGRQPAPLYDPC